MAMIERYIDDLVEFGIAETRFNRMRPDQRAFADHLLSSWRHRAIKCEGNYHVPAVRHAIKITLQRRP